MAARFAIVGDNTVDRYLGEHEHDFVGGNAVNVAAQLALAGASVAYFGAVGDDADGEFVRVHLAQLGIDLAGLIVLPGRTALTRISVAADGERNFDSEDFGVTEDYFPSDDDLDAIAAADWVQLGMLLRATELRQAVTARRAVPIGQDCAVSDGYDSLLVAFASAGPDDPWPIARAAQAAGCAVSVATRGSLGAVALAAGERFEVTATAAHVVDTTGAGDSFIAGFIDSFVEEPDVAAALEAGSRMAAATCGHRGGFPQSGERAA